jgi:hypothetical protein
MSEVKYQVKEFTHSGKGFSAVGRCESYAGEGGIIHMRHAPLPIFHRMFGILIAWEVEVTKLALDLRSTL